MIGIDAFRYHLRMTYDDLGDFVSCSSGGDSAGDAGEEAAHHVRFTEFVTYSDGSSESTC